MSAESIKPGQIYIIAAASGTGKTSLVNRLLAEIPTLTFTVSHTTRAPRASEVNGTNYHFVDESTFFAMRDHNDFVESALVHGNHYGTSKTALKEQLKTGKDVLMEIDWQGARDIKQLCHDVESIFILPPSFEELRTRLNSRGQDTPEVIKERLAMANTEMAHFDEFDHWLVNDDFEKTLQTLKSIIERSA